MGPANREGDIPKVQEEVLERVLSHTSYIPLARGVGERVWQG